MEKFKKTLRVFWLIWLASFIIFGIVLFILILKNGPHNFVPDWYAYWGFFNLFFPVLLGLLHMITYMKPIWEEIKEFVENGL